MVDGRVRRSDDWSFLFSVGGAEVTNLVGKIAEKAVCRSVFFCPLGRRLQDHCVHACVYGRGGRGMGQMLFQYFLNTPQMRLIISIKYIAHIDPSHQAG